MRVNIHSLSVGIVTLSIVAAGCSATAVPTVNPTQDANATPGTPVATGATSTTATTQPGQVIPATSSPAPSGTVAAGATSGPENGNNAQYVDNRSDATGLMASFVNSLNRKEYVRAYSYWESSAQSQLPPFNQFQQGYADTSAVELKLGTIGGDAGAGQFHNTVPATLIVKTPSGGTQTFVGCYVLHLANPSIQGTPPFMPLAIQSAVVQKVDNNADTAALMAKACQQGGIPQAPPVPPTAANLPSAQRYIDDRSGPLQVMDSFVNALNRKEYLRAYSYFEANAPLPSFDKFQQGYANTQAVTHSTGTVTSDAGAGQVHYNVPVTFKVKTTGGAAQTFVGCYRMHLANPGIQGTPPFQPMGISAANMQQVDNNADTGALMQKSCQ